MTYQNDLSTAEGMTGASGTRCGGRGKAWNWMSRESENLCIV